MVREQRPWKDIVNESIMYLGDQGNTICFLIEALEKIDITLQSIKEEIATIGEK